MLQSVTECYRVFLAHLLGPIFGLVSFDLMILQGERFSSHMCLGKENETLDFDVYME